MALLAPKGWYGIAVPVCLALLMWPAQPYERCRQCGMDLSKYQRTQYEIRWIDGSVSKTCGVQCGLTQQILHREKFQSAVAKDYYTGNPFDAQTGYYVFGSRVLADMAPGLIAFSLLKDAKKFQAESGGRVLSFEEALSTWTQRRASH